MNVSSAPSALVNTASSATPGTVQGTAALSVLKQSMKAQENAAAQLIAALPQPAQPSASLGGLGSHVDTYA
jgi:hypothetical protein